MTTRLRSALIGLVALSTVGLGLAACSGAASTSRSAISPAGSPPAAAAKPVGGTEGALVASDVADTAAAAKKSTYTKVMVIPFENETESAVIGSSHAPYLTALAKKYGRATDMQAGYPTKCQSLGAYLLFTSGSWHGQCADKPATQLQISGNNVFQQVADAGKQWREYAESMSGTCQKSDGHGGVYLVRHAPPPYYRTETTGSDRCAKWDVLKGRLTKGHLHHDLKNGLHTLSIVTPNACHDMHGAKSCSTSKIKHGDNWAKAWMPKIIASKDFQAGKLAVILTWDEGTSASNHIPTLIVTKSTHAVKSAKAYTHCSTLRTIEQVVGLPYLGCAATATSFRSAFNF